MGKKFFNLIFIGISLFAISLWIFNLLISLKFFGFGDERGIFGDTFGFVNSIFSGMAFIGVIYSITLQREEVKLLIEESSSTKKILSTQEKNIEDQNNIIRKQEFESTFFSMFNNFNESVSHINITISGNKFKGKEAISEFYKKILKYFDSQINEFKSDRIKENGSEYNLSLDDYKYIIDPILSHEYEYQEVEIGHYFRYLYTIMNFVHKSSIKTEDKYFYMKLLREQISNSEASLLSINYLSSYSTDAFNELVNKYSFLKNAEFEKESMIGLYQKIGQKAFGKRIISLKSKKITKSLFE